MGETVDFLTDREFELSVLSNYFQYSVDGAFILKESGGFRLVVQRQGAVACKEEFDTDEEARAAFLDLFGYNDDEITQFIKPVWSALSRPRELALKPHVHRLRGPVLSLFLGQAHFFSTIFTAGDKILVSPPLFIVSRIVHLSRVLRLRTRLFFLQTIWAGEAPR